MRILIASPIDKSAIRRLESSHDVVCCFHATSEELRSLVRDREVLVFRSGVRITKEILSAAPDLRLLVRAGCGLDNLDTEYASQRGIRLERIRRPAAQAVSEMALALMLNLARQVRQADESMRRGQWAKDNFRGRLLYQRTLGIVGAGNIGSRLGQIGAALGMTALGCVEHPSIQVERRLSAKGIALASFEEVACKADFLAVTVPLKDSTRKLIGEEALSRMKAGAFLINVSRGGVVDEEALYRHLADRRLAGAALDVHSKEGEGHRSPLADLPNVLLSPHIGSMTVDTQRAIGERVLAIVESYARREAAA